jgi:uncharacterized protein YdhG (YjbR/CyaY superfamily)
VDVGTPGTRPEVKMKTVENIDVYIAEFPEEVRKILEKVRLTIHQAAPEATEAIKYKFQPLCLTVILYTLQPTNTTSDFTPLHQGLQSSKMRFPVIKTPKGQCNFR